MSFQITDMGLDADADGVVYSSSSSGSARRWKYHVFLSFRGEDTRKNFTDHLYHALLRKGILTFRDDEELGRGQVIKPSLLRAIEESLSAIVVLSPKYASSAWCLDELVKILHSKKELGLQVFPIFYGVDPSDVRHQTGGFAEVFEKFEEKFTQDIRKVQKWRDALEEVANLSGWHSNNWHETELIEIVMEKVWSKLNDELPFDSEILVGIESKIAELDSVVASRLGGVRFIGIWGIGGSGKTTLARAFYEQKHKDFEVHCFIHNVRELSNTVGLISLQRKLLSSLDRRSMDVGDSYEGRKLIKNLFCNRKFLLVLDDVSDICQLENLAGKQGWFGNGSRIIMTTRDKHLLSHGVSIQYDIKFLSFDESLQLFHQNAFKGKQPNEDYLEFSKTVIQYAGGLPLALKVLGSFLCGRSILEWKDAIAKFKKVPPNDILKILKVSFDGLEDDEKTIFLDIACFFKGKDEDFVIQILQNLDLHPIIGIKVLVDKSLVINDRGTLWMHDMLQELGRNIVFQESPDDVGKRSRIWSSEDANHVLERNKGTDAIRGIVFDLDKLYVAHWDPEAFSKMSNLKLLIISSGSYNPHCYLNLPRGLKCLSSALKVLEWEGCLLDALPSQVLLEELVDIKLKHSQLKQLWRGGQVLGRLKFIDLSNSRYLIRTPNFDEIPNLQKLILKGCINLVEVHPSLGRHKNLVLVDLKDCESVKSLPRKFEMKCLETFILSGCLKIRHLPEFGKSMERLSNLDLEKTGITKLPESLVNLTSLAVLNLRNCKNLVCLPNVIQYLKCIRILNFSGCPKLSRLPENLNENVALEELDGSETAIKEVPPSILQLKNLKVLSFSRCTGQTQSSLMKFTSHFSRFFRLPRPSISSGLVIPPSLPSLSSLMVLQLSNCNLCDESLPNDINGLSSLGRLDLSGNHFVNLPTNFFSNLSKLKYIDLNHCPKLRSLPQLPLNVMDARASDCPSMKRVLSSQLLWQLFKQYEYQDGEIPDKFMLNIVGSEVPTWFHNQNYFCEEDGSDCDKPNVSFMTEMPDHCRSGKWWGIAVCLVIEGDLVYAPFDCCSSPYICWTIRDYSRDKAPTCFGGYTITEQYNCHHQLVMIFFPFVMEKKIQMIFTVHDENKERKRFEIRKCGWRVLCNEDVETWRKTSTSNADMNIDSDKHESFSDVGVKEVTNHNSNYDNFSTLDVDPHSPLTKRRKLE